MIDNGAAILPTGWALKKIGELGSVIRGASPRPKGDRRYYGGSIPRLMVEDVTRDGKVVFPQVDSLTEEGAKRSRPCKKGTLTIVCSGTVGIPSFLGVDACIHDGFLALVDIRKNISDDYLYHQFLWQKEKFDSSATHGGVFTNLTTEGVRDLSVPIPIDFDEQEAISRALSDVDDLLAKLDQLIVKKSDIKKGAMQELLTGKRRLPGFTDKWREKLFGELFSFSGGYSASRADLSHKGLCYLHYGDIHLSEKTYIDLASEEADIPKLDIAPNKVSKASLLEDGDVVFVDASEDDEGVSKHVVISNPEGMPFISGLHTIVAKSKTGELDNRFKRFCFQTAEVKEQFKFFAVGTKVSGISKTNVAKIWLRFPGIEEQSAIATILADMEAEISELKSKRAKMADIKQGMMQQLLTGKIRLV